MAVAKQKAYSPRLKERYEKAVIDALQKEREYLSIMAVPRLEKIVVSMGVGESIRNKKLLDAAVTELGQITGQKAIVTKARRSIAAFKVRRGMNVGCKVTLRGTRMYEFLDRLLSISLPRVKDFRGVNPQSFDGRGNYSLGIREQIVFPEIDYDRIERVSGLNITIITTARTDEEGRALLAHFGMPFRK